MKINILLVLLLVVIMNGFCQSIHFDFLMRAVKCNNYMHFEDFMKSKESGFKFDTSLSPRNFTLINKYLSTKEMWMPKIIRIN